MGNVRHSKKRKKVRKTRIKVFKSVTLVTLSIRKQKTASKSVKKCEFYVDENIEEILKPRGFHVLSIAAIIFSPHDISDNRGRLTTGPSGIGVHPWGSAQTSLKPV